MPRAVNGTYTLPAGNPVVTATVISSVWANTTLSDLATAMTGSLARNGDGGMTGQLKLDSGLIGAPGLTWSAETTSGLYRAGAGDFRYSILAADVIQIVAASFRFPDGAIAAPGLAFRTDTNSGLYSVGADNFRAGAGGVAVVGFTTTQLQPFLQIAASDGAAGTPMYSFSNDPDSGMYRVGADFIGFSAGGGARWNYNTTRLLNDLQYQGQDGSAGSPGITFSNDPDTGIWRSGANDIRISTAGAGATQGLSVQPGFLRPYGILILGDDGTAGNPVYTFNNDANTGIYSSAADSMGFTAGGVLRVELSTTVFQASVRVGAGDGAVGTPGFYFTSDPNTGLYRAGADDVVMSVGGNPSMQWLLNGGVGQSAFADGSAGVPGLSYNNDLDTGFYRDTANQIAISLGGVTAGQIAQGTFTGTLTGCTTAPTQTFNYLRVGKYVKIWLTASLTATSNATTMTVTGVPAIIRPTNVKHGFCFVEDNSVTDFLGDMSTDSGGTMTFSIARTDSTANYVRLRSTLFTNSGVKGLQSDWSVSYVID